MSWFDGYFQNLDISVLEGSTGKATQKLLSSIKNRNQFINQFMVKMQDALQRYHFEGLPETVNERVILLALLWYGSVVFFDKDGELMALPCVPDGAGFNVYGEVGSVWCFARNGLFNKNIKCYIHGSDELAFLDETNGYIKNGEYRGVCVWENALRYPFINQAIFYSEAVADSMRTLDVCRKNIKNPYIITAEESVVNTVKEYFKKRDNNEEYIVSSGIFPADRINLLPLTTNSDNLASITALIEWYESKWRELCGVDNNSQIDKKGENLIEAELSVNDEYTDLAIDKVLPYIQTGLDDVNKIFGTNISVQKNNYVQIIGQQNKDDGGDKNDDANIQ